MRLCGKNPILKHQLIEWRTVALFLLTYLCFLLLTLSYQWLPWWLILPLGSAVLALYGSLQHEVIHGHPTRFRKFNEALVFPSLWLWLPYALYRDSHLQHHKNELISDPFDDPESFYVSSAAWQTMGRLRRSLYWLRNTLLGRLVAGPLWVLISFLKGELLLCLQGDGYRAKVWSLHLISVIATLLWLSYCEIPLIVYFLLFIYPSLSLTLLRSFLEHQADPVPAHRTVIVQSQAFFSLLFLNNNLHALHHEQPGIPWYQLPSVWNEDRQNILKRNGGYYYPGYFSIFKQYLLTPKVHPRHPQA